MNTNETLAAGIRKARRMELITREEAAKRAGVSVRLWCRWEEGLSSPDKDAIEKALGMGVDKLMDLGLTAE